MNSGFAKELLGAAYRKVVQLNVARQSDEYRYVFVLAHMRSGSTLLSHVLANHPEFEGAGETHVVYKTAADLQNLILYICQRLRKFRIDAKYVVDQINHDSYLTPEVLASPKVYKCVILIRAPEATIQSMMSLFGWDEKTAGMSYVDRLNTLASYGQMLGQRGLLIEYDDLVDRTEQTLAGLTEFLGVEQTFTSNYATNSATGRFGDPSKNIVSGRILRTQSHKIKVGVEILAEASTAFESCKRQLLAAGIQLTENTHS
jgi:hypothetical protein